MSTTQFDIPIELNRSARKFGYGVAVVVNLLMLVVVQNILEWGWLPFLTEEFAAVVPWISMSLVVSIVANLVYEFNDTRIVKSTGQILINLISVLITYQIFTVFPFDFSAYVFNWALVTRIFLILAMVGAGIGVLTEAMRLAADGPDKERR